MNTVKSDYQLSDIGRKIYEVFGEPIVGLSGITRFSRRLKVRDENVAEHMWYVSFITLQLCKILCVNDNVTNLALKYAICHDVPELVLDDVNHDVKERFPGIRQSLEGEEEVLFGMLGEDIKATHIPTDSRNHKIAKLIVDLADVHSVAMYMFSEINLGNMYFSNEYGEPIARIKELENELWRVLDYGSEADKDILW